MRFSYSQNSCTITLYDNDNNTSCLLQGDDMQTFNEELVICEESDNTDKAIQDLIAEYLHLMK